MKIGLGTGLAAHRATGAPAGPPPPASPGPPVFKDVTKYANATIGATFVTTPSKTYAANALVLLTTLNNGGSDPESITCCGEQMTRLDGHDDGGGGHFLSRWFVHLPSGGTGTNVLDVTANEPLGVIVFTEEIPGSINGPLDRTASAAGAGTAPSSGNISPSVAFTLAHAASYTAGTPADTAGTWSDSFTRNQRDGNTVGGNMTLDIAYKQLDVAPGTVAGAKTGQTSRAWMALIANLKSS